MARRILAPALRRALTGRGPARPVESKSLAGRVLANFRQYVVPGQPYTQDWSTDRAVKEGFEVNPWIFRAVHVTAQALIAKKIVLRQGDAHEGRPIEPSADPTRLLHLLNVQTNDWERAKLFRYRLIAQYLLSSRGVFIEVTRTRAGKIGMLNLLDPDLTEIVPTRTEFADGTVKTDPLGAFRVTLSSSDDGPYNLLPRYDPKATHAQQPQSVLWVRLPHPTMMFQGMSPMQAAALSADMDRAARLYNKRALDSDGLLNMLIMVKGTVEQDTLEIIEGRVNGGPGARSRAVALAADAVDVKELSNAARDIQWAEGSERARKEISIAFGVPESVLGDASGRTFDNADAEVAIWKEHTLLPLAESLDDQLDILTGGYDDQIYLRHDFSDDWLLGRHKRENAKQRAADVAAGLVTIDEYRAAAGLPEMNIPATRVLYLPGGRVPAGADEDVTALAELTTLGAGQAADPAEEARRGAETGSQAGVHAAENINNARSLRLVSNPPPVLERRAVQPELEDKQGRARADQDQFWR